MVDPAGPDWAEDPDEDPSATANDGRAALDELVRDSLALSPHWITLGELRHPGLP
jgi:Flp pilus assembly CpaF family ATPase